jgi:hypothetical protein
MTPAVVPVSQSRPAPEAVRLVYKALAVAISVIMAVGLAVSVALCAPWYVPLSFFAAVLVPLLVLGKADNDPRSVFLDSSL